MGPILINLQCVQFNPQDKRQTERLEHGTFTFSCSFKYQGEEATLGSWRIVNAEYIDSLDRHWTLLDEFEVTRAITSLGGAVQFSFELSNLDKSAHYLVEGGRLRITLSGCGEAEIQEYVIFHEGALGPLAWKLDRRAVNG